MTRLWKNFTVHGARCLLGAMGLTLLVGLAPLAPGQEKSVKPGINENFVNPDVAKYAKTFEGESREVYVNRDKIVEACELKPGMIVADVGAGTGLFTRLFAQAVGPKGQVYAVDIAPNFLEHIQKTSRAAKLTNVTPVLCNQDSVDLPPNSVDVVFTSDTYHHFEFPQRTLASIHRALKPGGRLIIVDFIRIAGESSDWVLNHVRAGQDVVEKEIIEAGFTVSERKKDLLKENYFVTFTKPMPKLMQAPRKKIVAPLQAAPKKVIALKNDMLVSPVVPGYGGVLALPDALEQPQKGSKFVIDVTAVGKEPDQPTPGLVRAATLLNLAGVSGLKAGDLSVAIVLHGDAMAEALSSEQYQAFKRQPHPHDGLLGLLQKGGVEVYVCGQSLARKGFDPNQKGLLRPGVKIAASAVTAVANFQSRGYAYIPAH